jgi:hypothetical protein
MCGWCVPVSNWFLGILMGTPLPPIYRDIRRLLVHTEGVVSRFARYPKYTVGTDMRTQAMQLMRCVHRAVYEPARQPEHVGALVWLVDNYKLTLQLAMEVGAFTHSAKGTPSFAGFETAATLAAGIGKQCGGWQQKTASRQRATNGSAPGGAQPVGPQPAAQPQASPASLSACAASKEATP